MGDPCEDFDKSMRVIDWAICALLVFAVACLMTLVTQL